MRHRKTISKLGKTASHRHALMANLASALIISKKIKTTKAKAKALRSYIEPLITKARTGTLSSRRIVLKLIPRKEIVKELFDEIAPKFVDRPGGYTRITKLGKRTSDTAEMALIEFVGFESVYKKKKEKSKKDRQEKKDKKEKEAKEAEEQQAASLQEVEESEK
jgi:large subunit ribosomal protein L17